MKCRPQKEPSVTGAAKPETGGGRVKLKPGAVVERVRKMIEPLCTSEGIELVHVEYRREPGGRVLRLYIDKPGGVRVDDCAMISRQVGDYLDVALGLEEAYRLEVSSPGLHRPLVKAEDFERFKGRTAKIRTREPLDGRKNFKGLLQGISDGIIRIMVDSDTVSIPFDQVEKAVLDD